MRYLIKWGKMLLEVYLGMAHYRALRDCPTDSPNMLFPAFIEDMRRKSKSFDVCERMRCLEDKKS